MARHGLTQLAAAEALGVSDPTVNAWVNDDKRPVAHHREAIAVWTNGEVAIESWLRDEERAAMAGVSPFVPRDASTRDLAVDESGEHPAIVSETG